MFDLEKLIVSLTKHGAHKVATLIEHYPIPDVLQHVDDDDLDIHVDLAQTKKNLSCYDSDLLPEYWTEIKSEGSDYINAAVLMSIVFSHKEFIKVFIHSTDRFCDGIIKRHEVLAGKNFTNLVCILDELGYVTEHNVSDCAYNFSEIFDLPRFGNYVYQILLSKLRFGGMGEEERPIDVMLENGFNYVFGLTNSEFRSWSENSSFFPSIEITEISKEINVDPESSFSFTPGHGKRSTKTVAFAISGGKVYRKSHHNEIQNALYDYLVEKHGKKFVGTEISTGCNSRIDVVTKISTGFDFYEIKTGSSLKLCVREALSQLLEYSHWSNDHRAQALVIVTQHPISDKLVSYLNLLRESYNIPIQYMHYDFSNNSFSEIN